MPNKNNNKLRLLIFGVTVLVIVAGIAGSYYSLETNHEALVNDHVELKEDGCDPAREHTTQIAVIDEKLGNIIKTQEKQDGKLDQILRRLPE